MNNAIKAVRLVHNLSAWERPKQGWNIAQSVVCLCTDWIYYLNWYREISHGHQSGPVVINIVALSLSLTCGTSHEGCGFRQLHKSPGYSYKCCDIRMFHNDQILQYCTISFSSTIYTCLSCLSLPLQIDGTRCFTVVSCYVMVFKRNEHQ